MSRTSRFFIARQPITDRAGGLRGFELQFRGAATDLQAFMADGTRGTAQVLTEGVLVEGLGSLTGGLPAFVNFSEELLTRDFGLVLTPVDSFVVELAEDVGPTDEVLAACRRLRARGVRVALDDVVDARRILQFEGNIDVARVNLPITDPHDLEAIVRASRRHHLKLLGAKIETNSAYEAAHRAGFDYFQGWSIGRPVPVEQQHFAGLPAAHFHLLRALRDPNAPARELVRLVMADPSLAYKLLRYANSARAAQLQPVTSIHRALLLFGVSDLRRAVELLVLSGLAGHSSVPLLVQAVTRARFCEMVAFRLHQGDRCPDFALVGLFSNLDILLGISLEAALARLPLEADMVAAILQRRGTMGSVLGLAISYESGRWDEVRQACGELGLNEHLLPAVNLRAVTSAHTLVAAA